jgi:hypothetical protein
MGRSINDRKLKQEPFNSLLANVPKGGERVYRGKRLESGQIGVVPKAALEEVGSCDLQRLLTRFLAFIRFNPLSSR